MRSRVVGGWLLAAIVAAVGMVACMTSGGAGPRGAAGFAGPRPTALGGSDARTRASARALQRSARPTSTRALGALEAGCILFTERAATATSQDCLACHERGAGGATQLRRCHPVEFTYAPPPEALLRAADEVIRRGVFLPDGMVRCVTCHDGASPWDVALALPPGSTATAAVDPGDPRTYDPAYRRTAPEPGDRVSPRPLCLACHAFD